MDASPGENNEFVPAVAEAAQQALRADFTAAPGGAAVGRLDLLTVLIHELGHVLGLPMPAESDGAAMGEHVMSQYLAPGQRRLPDAVDIATLHAVNGGAYVRLAPSGVGVVGTVVNPAPGSSSSRFEGWGQNANATLLNGDFGANGIK